MTGLPRPAAGFTAGRGLDTVAGNPQQQPRLRVTDEEKVYGSVLLGPRNILDICLLSASPRQINSRLTFLLLNIQNHSNTPFTRYNRLSIRLSNGLTTVLNEQPLFVQPVVKPACTTGLTIGCIHDNGKNWPV